MSLRTVHVRTAVDGSFDYERNLYGAIHAIAVELGTLETPDIDITDDTNGTSFLSVNGVAADTVYKPSMPLQNADGTDADVSDETGVIVGALAVAACMGVLKVAITGAGDTKTGLIRILYT